MPGKRVITRLRIEGYKALRCMSVGVPPFAVVVGGNACGKSSLLDAIALLYGSASHPIQAGMSSSDLFAHAFTNAPRVENGLSIGADPPRIQVEALLSPPIITADRHRERSNPVECGLRLEVSKDAAHLYSRFSQTPPGKAAFCNEEADWKSWNEGQPAGEVRTQQRDAGLGPVPALRLDPRVLARPSPVAVGDAQLGNDGSNLAAVLRDLRDRDDGSFVAIADSLRAVVPSIRQLRVRKIDVPGDRGSLVPAFGIEARIRDAKEAWCPADELSEGTLMTLAILTAMYTRQTAAIVLLDDIDRGLHPSAQRKLIRLLRDLRERTPHFQILCTTHSPYTVDSFSMDEVIVLKLDKASDAHAQRLVDHPEAEKWKALMDAGEFWTSVGEDWVFGS